MKTLLALTLVAAVITLFVHWTAWHTDALMEAGKGYEECVKAETGMSPAEYRAVTGLDFGVCN